MNLNIENVVLLGLNQSYRFFEAGLNYSNSKVLSIEGTLNDLTNPSGISGVWFQLNQVKSTQNFESLTLNGYDFGSGRILSYDFPEGNDVKIKSYSIELEVFETGDLYNLTETHYSGIDLSNSSYLQDFNESYSFNKKDNGGYSYNHNASIRFNSGIGQLNAIESAKILAKSLFTGNSLGFAFYSGFTSKLGKRFYTESYNQINNSCEFGEVFDFDSNQGTYSLVKTNNFSLDDAGIITVSENGVIKGIETPTYLSATNAIDSVVSGSYERAIEIANYYAPSGSLQLINSAISQARSLNIFDNIFSYSVSYSNNRSNSGSFFWNYSQNVTKNQESVTVLNENGSIVGRGGNKIDAYQNAKNAFVNIKSGAYERGLAFYQSNGIKTPIFIESQGQSDSPFRGAINYNFVFSNEPVITGFSGVKYIKINESNSYPIFSYTEFGIFNQKTIIQDQSNGLQGTKLVTLEIKGEKETPLNIYLGNGKNVINSNIPSGANVRITQSDYSYSKNTNTVSLNVGWEYNRSSTRTIQI
jgi:hypothetical protein